MKISDKILLLILLLICLIFACTNVYCTFFNYLTTFGCLIGLDEIIGTIPTIIFDLFISFGLLIVVCKLFAAVFLSGSKSKSDDYDFIPVYDDGDNSAALAFITPSAIEQIAKKHTLTHRSVSECKAYLSKGDDDVFTISVVIVPVPDACIPTISSEIKESVKATVEAQTGIRLSDVFLYVFPQGNKLSKSNIF